MLKPFLLLSVVALVVFAPLAVPALPPQEAAPAASKNPVKPTAASQEKAKKLYAMDCALCHGQTGDGKTDLAKDMQLTMSDWTDPKSLSDRLDQELFNVIRHGKGKMPAEEVGRAKDDEVWNLIIYIRTFAKAQPAAPAPPAAPVAAPAPPPAPGTR
jgi:cytochrome c